MPQPRPAYISGGYYHFFNRGNHKTLIFREPDNYLFLLRNTKKYLSDLNLTLIAYCLMPNHYHFLVRQDGDHPAGLLIQRIFNSYSKAYNKRYLQTGTLFEDNYRVKAITQTSHLLHLCRYIHANPVKDGFVSQPTDWPYSNLSRMGWITFRLTGRHCIYSLPFPYTGCLHRICQRLSAKPGSSTGNRFILR